ncbi:MAG: hypothetical protein JNL10_03740 [Verrucomicrobiales bacterium]|nr:hypothetical protein [Verrucomicrobiales bacterium]
MNFRLHSRPKTQAFPRPPGLLRHPLAVVLLLLMALGLPVRGESRVVQLSLAGLYGSNSEAKGCAVVGPVAYIASGSSGLEVVDVGNPLAPVRLGGLDTSGSAFAVEVVGTLAYVADGSAGLQIIDVSQPSAPVRVGGFNTSGFARGVRVVGTRAYVADSEAGLQLIDVSDPAAPVRVSGVRTTSSVLDVSVVGTTVYVANGSAGLLVLDYTDPGSPRRLATYKTNGSMGAVSAVGDRCFVADSDAGLLVFDMSTPSAPLPVGGLALRRSVWGITLSGDLAFLAGSFGGLDVVDISNPFSPVVAGGLSTASATVGVAVSGGRVHVTVEGTGLGVYDLRSGLTQDFAWTGVDGNLLVPQAPYSIQVTSSAGIPTPFRVESGPARLAGGVLTVTNLGTVVLTAENAGDATHVPWKESRTFNVSSAVMKQVGATPTRNYANEVRVAGGYAYVADGLAGMTVVDLRNPAIPTRVATFETGGDARGLDLTGGFAVVAAWDRGVQILDISRPDNPVRVATVESTGFSSAVQVVGSLAYVADGPAGLQILDLGNPSQSKRIGGVDTPGDALGLDVVGSLAYVADGSSGLQIIDVSNPAAPVVVGTWNSFNYPRAVRVEGSLAYVAEGFGGFAIVDVARPEAPTLVGRYTVPGGRFRGVTLSGEVALVSDLFQGLHVLDVSTPSTPRRMEYIPTEFEAYATVVDGGRVYLAEGLGGLRIFDLSLGLPQTVAWSGDLGEILVVGTPYPVEAVSNSGIPLGLRLLSGPAVLSEGVLTVTNLGPVTLVAENAGGNGFLPYEEFRSFNQPITRFTRVGEADTAGLSLQVREDAGIAYVADGRASGLVLYDLANPAAPARLGAYKTSGSAVDVQVSAGIAYVADLEGGVEILDVRTPASITRIGRIETSGVARRVGLVGTRLYLAHLGVGLEIYDVQAPANPKLLGSYELPEIFEVEVVGDYAYCLDRTGSLLILDVSNPTRVSLTGSTILRNTATRLASEGTLLLVAGGSQGLWILDVSNPSAPRRAGSFSPGGVVRDVVAAEGVAYLVTSDSLLALDVSDPARPRLRGQLSGLGDLDSVSVSGNRALVAARLDGFRVVDIQDGHPQRIDLALPDTVPFSGSPIPLGGTATSGLPIRYEVISGPASVQEGRLLPTGVGRVVLRAEQPGDGTFLGEVLDIALEVGLPVLAARTAGDAAEVFWAAGLPDLKLEGRETLSPASPWQETSLPRVEAGGEVHVGLGGQPLQYFRLRGRSGLVEPLQLQGWNRDVVLENRASPKALEFDSFGAVWFESGLRGYRDGLPSNLQVVSALDAGVVFQLQPYVGSNVLWLSAAKRTSSLTLVQPAAYGRIHVLAHSAGGGGSAALRIHYADGTIGPSISIVAPDWWDGSPSNPPRRPAIRRLARSQTAGFLTYDPVPPGFSMHQTDIDLWSGPFAGKVITELEFTRAGAAEVTGIFAVSGVEISPAP